MTAAPAVHGTAIVVGEHGILILGASGAGKSSLAEELIAGAAAEGRFAALVGDDRVTLEAVGGRLLARPHAAIPGLIELRGAGLVERPFEPAAILHLCVELDPAAPRLPDEAAEPYRAAGLALSRIVVNRPLACSVTRWRLRSLDDTFMIVG